MMEANDLTNIRSVLAERRKDVEDELPALDAAISRLDALIDAEKERVSQQDRIRQLSAARRIVA